MLQHRLIIALSAIGVVAGSMTGMAAGFPEKDITFVIPNRAGGGFDVYARGRGAVHAEVSTQQGQRRA